MSAQQSLPDVEPSERLRSLRRQRHQRQLQSSRAVRYRALGWELTGRLTVNLMLALVALGALVRLIPYHQTQRQVLSDMETSVETLRSQNSRLRQDFSRYFDPAQTGQVLQENGARESSQHVPIVWVDNPPSSFTEASTTTPPESDSPTTE